MPLTVTANLKDLTNAADVGWARFTLVGYGSDVPRLAGAVLSGTTVKATADVNGVISQVLVGNDAITPSGTTYVVEVFSSLGAHISSGRYSLTGSGTVDLSTLSTL